ncbi:MAG TPA: hypothetical protein VGM60_20605 [Pseudonocardia sp.]|uniref:hypothetical protein n=1 Tax=Pseudonocardia sp. TaxID=60912 RepID=UPI002F404C0E
MADRDLSTRHESGSASRRARSAPELFTLLVGLLSLAVAVLALVGWMPPVPVFDPRWLFAGGAGVVGLLLLMASVRSPKNGSTG